MSDENMTKNERGTSASVTSKIVARGWQCPVCGEVNAPFVTQCPCGGKVGYSLNGPSCFTEFLDEA